MLLHLGGKVAGRGIMNQLAPDALFLAVVKKRQDSGEHPGDVTRFQRRDHGGLKVVFHGRQDFAHHLSFTIGKEVVQRAAPQSGRRRNLGHASAGVAPGLKQLRQFPYYFHAIWFPHRRSFPRIYPSN